MKQLTRLGWLAIATLTFVGQASAAGVVQMSFEELVDDAEVAFEGRVVSAESHWNEDATAIYTRVTFEVEDVLKGALPSTVELSFMGGMVGDLRMTVSGLRIPRQGETGVYFIESTSRRLISPILGWNQGHFRVVGDAGERVVLTSNGRPLGGFTQQITTRQLNEHVPSGVVSAADFGSALPLASFKAHIQQRIERASNPLEVAR